MTTFHGLREPRSAPKFFLQRRRFGPGYVTQVSHPSGTRVEIADHGATLLSWRSAALGEAELTDGYASPEELAGQDGVRNGILAPFSNRIADGLYAFDGVTHDLLHLAGAGQRLIYHGFVRSLDLFLADANAHSDRATLTYRTAEIRPGRFPGYPFAIDVTVVYSVTLSGIELTISGRNVGPSAAPYGSGWHPYFRLPGRTVDQLVLRIPAHGVVATGADLIPLPGRAGIVATDVAPSLDLRRPRALAGLTLDTCYADLERGPEGMMRSQLYDPSTGASIDVWQERGLAHVFTGDTLARGIRQSLAIEPVELMTNAFNRPELQELVVLPPGQTRTFRCGASADCVAVANRTEPSEAVGH